MASTMSAIDPRRPPSASTDPVRARQSSRCRAHALELINEVIEQADTDVPEIVIAKQRLAVLSTAADSR
jgi:hypothetical protein